MARDIDEIKLGVCDVTYKGNHVGHTKEGVVVRYEAEHHEVTVDQFGNTPVDFYIVRENLTAVTTFAQREMARLRDAIPAGSAAPADRMNIGRQSGHGLRQHAGLLVLHPIASEDLKDDVVLYLAVSREPVELPYKFDEASAFEVTFVALPDESRSEGDHLGHIGDSNA